MKNDDLDSNYSMLLGRTWLRNARVTHDWGNNLITIEENGAVQTIIVTKHLDINTKHLEVLKCYDLMEGIIDEEKEIFFVVEPNLFTLGTITSSKLEILSVRIFDAKADMENLTFNFSHSEPIWILIDITPSCIKVQKLDIAH